MAANQKTARMEQRTTEEAKQIIDRAARLLGINASEFVVAAATKAARETVRDHEQMTLTAENHDAFLRAFEATEPTQVLVDLMKRHREITGSK